MEDMAVEKALQGAAGMEMPEGFPEGHFRVAAYCRVSTEMEAQQTSIALQKAAYGTLIRDNPDWELVDIYADEGVSGTGAEGRKEFQRMMGDCMEGKIDLIITKSLSRFSRNTLDCIRYIRLAQSHGAQIRFEKERITTGEACSELLLTILAAFAQEESRSLSENVKWSVRKRFQEGDYRWTACYGYRKGEDGGHAVVPEEAEVIRLVFDMYEQGYGSHRIANYVNDRGIPRPRGKGLWDSNLVNEILKNERYEGTMVMQKYFNPTHLEQRAKRNRGELPMYRLEDNHVAIVSKAQFRRAQEIRRMRGVSRYPFSDKLRCPYCGEPLTYRRIPIQECESHLLCENVGCRDFAIRAEPLKAAVLDAYWKVDETDIEELAAAGNTEAAFFLDYKEKHPSFPTVEYFWLDDLVDHMELGMHTYSAGELAHGMGPDDRTLTVFWKCGMKTTVPSGVRRDSQHPRHIAELWDGYLLRYPERHPELAKQAKMRRQAEK